MALGHGFAGEQVVGCVHASSLLTALRSLRSAARSYARSDRLVRQGRTVSSGRRHCAGGGRGAVKSALVNGAYRRGDRQRFRRDAPSARLASALVELEQALAHGRVGDPVVGAHQLQGLALVERSPSSGRARRRRPPRPGRAGAGRSPRRSAPGPRPSPRGRSSKKNDTGTSRIWPSSNSREEPIRLAPRSYFCTCWKVRPSSSPSRSWLMPSRVRRSRSALADMDIDRIGLARHTGRRLRVAPWVRSRVDRLVVICQYAPKTL